MSLHPTGDVVDARLSWEYVLVCTAVSGYEINAVLFYFLAWTSSDLTFSVSLVMINNIHKPRINTTKRRLPSQTFMACLCSCSRQSPLRHPPFYRDGKFSFFFCSEWDCEFASSYETRSRERRSLRLRSFRSSSFCACSLKLWPRVVTNNPKSVPHHQGRVYHVFEMNIDLIAQRARHATKARFLLYRLCRCRWHNSYYI